MSQHQEIRLKKDESAEKAYVLVHRHRVYTQFCERNLLVSLLLHQPWHKLLNNKIMRLERERVGCPAQSSWELYVVQ